MNYNYNHTPSGRWRFFLALVLCLSVIGGIIYMKRTTDSVLPAVRQADSLAEMPVALPDTSAVPGTITAEPDSVIAAMPADTLLGVDKRRPYEAGYEDGYATGCDDGANKKEHNSYDDTNNFQRKKDSDDYVKGYREGYEKGYADGKSGKQFNI